MLPLIFLFNYITAALFYQPLLDIYFKTEYTKLQMICNLGGSMLKKLFPLVLAALISISVCGCETTLPKKGDKGIALNRKGDKVCAAEVVNVRSAKAFDHTNLLTMKVPKEYAMKARFFREEETA
mgnify:CR=1 FL=1